MVTTEELVVRITGDIEDLKRELKKAEKAAGRSGARMQTAFKRADSTVRGLGRSLTGLKAALLGVGLGIAARQAIQMADTFKNMEARIRIVSTSAADAKQAMDGLFESAQRTGTGFESAAELFARVARSRQELGVTTGQLLQFTENLQKAIVISGASAAEANNAIIQLGQGLASGTLRGDELRSVMEQMPIVARAIADDMGVTIGTFRELAAEGKITSEVVLDAILKQTEKWNKQFENMPLTVGRATTQLNNALLRMVGLVDAGAGASQDLAHSISGIADTVSSPKFQNGIADWAKTIADTVKLLLENKGLITALGGAAIGARIGGLPGAGVGAAIGAVAGAKTPGGLQKLQDQLEDAVTEYDNLTLRQETFWGRLSGANDATVEAALDRIRKLRAAIKAMKEEMKADAFTPPSPKQVAARPAGLAGDETFEPAASKDVTKVLEGLEQKNIALKHELAGTNEELFVQQALFKAGVAQGSYYGTEIEANARKVYRLTEALKEKAQVQKDEEAELQATIDAYNEEGDAIDGANRRRSEAKIKTEELLQAQTQETTNLLKQLEARKQSELAMRIEIQLQQERLEAKRAHRKFDEQEARDRITRQEQIKQKIREIGEEERRSNELAKDLANTIANSLEDAAAMWEKLRDIAMRALVTKPLEAWLTKMFEGGFGSVFGGKDKANEKLANTLDTFDADLADTTSRSTDQLEGTLGDYNANMGKITSAGTDGLARTMDVLLDNTGIVLNNLLQGLNSMGGGGGGGFFGSILGGIGSLFGGGGGGGVNQAAAGGIGSSYGVLDFAKGGVMTSGGAMTLHKYASGGIANSPQMAVFGEGRQPEAYVPLPNGRSIPVEMSGGGTPVVVNQNINVSTGVVPTVRAEIVNMLPQIQRATTAAVQSTRHRDPAFFGPGAK